MFRIERQKALKFRRLGTRVGHCHAPAALAQIAREEKAVRPRPTITATAALLRLAFIAV